MTSLDPREELRKLFPPILTMAHVAEMMHCTIGDVRDKVHRGDLEALRWGQQFRFFREEVITSMTRFLAGVSLAMSKSSLVAKKSPRGGDL